MSLALEPLVIRRQGFSPCFRYSCLHSHSHHLHSSITRLLPWWRDAPLPTHTPAPTTTKAAGGVQLCECHSFGGVLEPRYIVGAEPLDQ